MLSPISNNTASSVQMEMASAKLAASSSSQQSSLQPDTISISSQAHTAATDADHDGDSH